MSSSEAKIFVGRVHGGVFSIFTSADVDQSDPGAICIEISMIEHGAIYYNKFSDTEMSKHCLGVNTHRTIGTWFSDFEIFEHRGDELIIGLLMKDRIVKIILKLRRVDLDADKIDAKLADLDRIIDTQQIAIKRINSMVTCYSRVARQRKHHIISLLGEKMRTSSEHGMKRGRETPGCISEWTDDNVPSANVESAALKGLRAYESDSDDTNQQSSDCDEFSPED